MVINPSIGTRVKLKPDSRFVGLGNNPSSADISGGILGYITAIEGHWLEVIWDGYSEAINYKAYDLDPGN